jgi:hypothetical protein
MVWIFVPLDWQQGKDSDNLPDMLIFRRNFVAIPVLICYIYRSDV